ncbi:hypothetical protein [Larkinella arboricola]
MQKTFLRTVFFILVTVAAVQAQGVDSTSSTRSDTIRIVKNSSGYHFYRKRKELKINQLQTLLKTNDQAYKYIKSAKSSGTLATTFAYAGGFLIGWPLGTLMGGGKPNWALAGVGAGLASISIPFSQSATKKAKKAVREYNSAINANSPISFKEFKVGVSANSVGLVFKF